MAREVRVLERCMGGSQQVSCVLPDSLTGTPDRSGGSKVGLLCLA